MDHRDNSGEPALESFHKVMTECDFGNQINDPPTLGESRFGHPEKNLGFSRTCNTVQVKPAIVSLIYFPESILLTGGKSFNRLGGISVNTSGKVSAFPLPSGKH
jgi:hypothetical protein